MEPPDPKPIDIFLGPGECFFGAAGVRIRTVLGSCVSIIMWHPQRRIGGMCHFVLPGRQAQKGARLDGRYAEDALLWLLTEVGRAGSKPAEYLVRLVGGGRMFEGGTDIGQRNIESARRLLREHNLPLQGEDIAGTGHREVIFDIASGKVWLKHVNEPILAWQSS